MAALLVALGGCGGPETPADGGTGDGGFAGDADGGLPDGGEPGSPDGGQSGAPDGGVDGGAPVDCTAPGAEAACVLRVEPDALSFGYVEPGESRTLEVSLRSAGACPCTVTGLRVEGYPAFSLAEPVAPSLTLAPGESAAVGVSFAPAAAVVGQRAAVRFAVSGEAAERAVPLTGHSSRAEVLIAPDDFDFGVLRVGCSAPEARPFCVYDTGDEPVHLTGLELVERGPGGEFTFETLPPGLAQDPPRHTIAPGERACFTLAYTPQDYGQDSAAVYVSLAEFADPFVVTLVGTGAEPTVQTDTFVQLADPQVDLVLVVDRSASMAEEAASLEANLRALVDYVARFGIDAALMALTTDVRDGGTLLTFGPEASPSLPVDRAGAADLLVEAVTGAPLRPDAPEAHQGLEAVRLALEQGELRARLRPEAYLAVIFVSDDDDASPGVLGDYLQRLWEVKGLRRKDLLSVSAIVSESPACRSGCGEAAGPDIRYRELQSRTGGVFESICHCRWADALQGLSMVAFGYQRRFFLQNVPRMPWPDHMEVTVHRLDGTQYTAVPRLSEGAPGEWWYEAEANEIRFDPLAGPEAGDVIEVTYTVRCL